MFFDRVMEFWSGQTVTVILFSNVIVLGLYWLAFFRRKERLSSYAGMRVPNFVSLLGAVCAGLTLNAFVGMCLEYLLFDASLLEQYGESIAAVFDGPALIALVTAVLAAPVVEELVFRGVLLSALQKGLNTWLAVLVSSGLFALAHGNPIQMGYAFVLGVILCVVRLRSRSLWSAVALHFAVNAANYWQVRDTLRTLPLALVGVILLVSCVVACVKKRTAEDQPG